MTAFGSGKQSEEKAWRMALRRDVGNRTPPAARSTCTGAGTYLVAHACFRCRKSFKVPPRPVRDHHCPCCRAPLLEMGRSFRAPRSRDVAQWKKVQALHAAGFRFFSYRSVDCPALPAKYSQVVAFIRDNPNHPMRIAGQGDVRSVSRRPLRIRMGAS